LDPPAPAGGFQERMCGGGQGGGGGGGGGGTKLDCGEDDGLDSSSCLVKRFKFVVLTSLMSAHVALNCDACLEEFH